jgi:hypothetical protein
MNESVFALLGQELVNNPYLSIMILNENYEIVWHNERFGEEMGDGADMKGQNCFKVVGSQTPHDTCPLMQTIREQKRIKGFLDFGDRNFLYMTVPLGDKLAAKIHMFLPKEVDNSTVVK